MGSIARMDPKPPLSCCYMARPSPQPIGQNRVFKFERAGTPPLKFVYFGSVISHIMILISIGYRRRIEFTYFTCTFLYLLFSIIYLWKFPPNIPLSSTQHAFYNSSIIPSHTHAIMSYQVLPIPLFVSCVSFNILT